MNDKQMTLRLPHALADDLQMIATVDGKPVSVEIREAVALHVQRRRADPQFRVRLRRVIDENQAALDRLSGDVS